MQQNGFRRLKSDGDDLTALGREDDIKQVVSESYERFLLNETGQLNSERDKTRFLARNLETCGDTVVIFEDKAYYESLLNQLNMQSGREAPAPATFSASSSPTRG